jgi:hypothetical protein
MFTGIAAHRCTSRWFPIARLRRRGFTWPRLLLCILFRKSDATFLGTSIGDQRGGTNETISSAPTANPSAEKHKPGGFRTAPVSLPNRLIPSQCVVGEG